jgi:hypothetical protein
MARGTSPPARVRQISHELEIAGQRWDNESKTEFHASCAVCQFFQLEVKIRK